MPSIFALLNIHLSVSHELQYILTFKKFIYVSQNQIIYFFSKKKKTKNQTALKNPKIKISMIKVH